MMTTVRIDAEFAALIPPLSADERDLLEASIRAEGCREALVVWNRDNGAPILLDGHNRLKICEALRVSYDTRPMDFETRAAAKVWIVRNQLGRRNLQPYQRYELAQALRPELERRAKENQASHTKQGYQTSDKPVNVKKEMAKAAGLSHDTIHKAEVVDAHADDETKAALRKGEMTINRAFRKVSQAEVDKKREAARKEAAAAAPAKQDERIIVGDFRQHQDRIPDASLSLIFTDPPYNKAAAPLLSALAAFADRKLADGGSLLCYVGHTQIPAALDAFRAHLRYWWTIACVHAGRATVMREYGINAKWKAVLWFVKRTRGDKQTMVNDVMSGGQEKDHHEWQQAESEAAYWIERLCPRDGLVCDPFLGSGTTAVAAERLGRRWLAFEVDPGAAAQARMRIHGK